MKTWPNPHAKPMSRSDAEKCSAMRCIFRVYTDGAMVLDYRQYQGALTFNIGSGGGTVTGTGAGSADIVLGGGNDTLNDCGGGIYSGGVVTVNDNNSIYPGSSALAAFTLAPGLTPGAVTFSNEYIANYNNGTNVPETMYYDMTVSLGGGNSITLDRGEEVTYILNNDADPGEGGKYYVSTSLGFTAQTAAGDVGYTYAADDNGGPAPPTMSWTTNPQSPTPPFWVAYGNAQGETFNFADYSGTTSCAAYHGEGGNNMKFQPANDNRAMKQYRRMA